MARRDRNTSLEDINPTQNEETVSTDTVTADAETVRSPRPQIDTTNVTVGEGVDISTISFNSHSSKLDSDHVALAVRNAERGKAYPLTVTAENVKQIESLARRAVTKRSDEDGKGIRFDKSRVVTDGVLYFAVGDKRKTNRKPKDTEAEGTNASE